MNYKKIMIIGKPGSGKSTIAKQLQKLLSLPLYHIDQYYFNPDWSKQDLEKFMQTQNKIVNSDEWIIEGCSTKTFEVRWQKADIVIFLNYSNVVCLWRLIKRRFSSDITAYSRPEGSKNTLPWHLISYMLNFERNNKDTIMALHKKYKNIPFYEITNDTELKHLMTTIFECKKMNKVQFPINIETNPIVKKQIIECANLITKILGQDVLGVYLYGSATTSGLEKYSDIDLLIVSNRSTTREEKRQLVKSLLTISGLYMKEEKRPIELTIVEKSAVNPWHYPPTFDFQYGEWLRKGFEHGNTEPWPTKEMPDLAILITQVILASTPLIGPTPDTLLPNVPYKDIITATADALTHLQSAVKDDTRNVLLTLARIWSMLTTDIMYSKPAAADWVINNLPKKQLPAIKRAKAICIGEEKEQWNDIENLIQPCTDFMLNKIHNKVNEIMSSGDFNRTIKIAKNK